MTSLLKHMAVCRMSDAARQTVRDMGRMYEELYGGCGGVAPMTRDDGADGTLSSSPLYVGTKGSNNTA
jgi:hypothetical protein